MIVVGIVVYFFIWFMCVLKMLLFLYDVLKDQEKYMGGLEMEIRVNVYEFEVFRQVFEFFIVIRY